MSEVTVEPLTVVPPPIRTPPILAKGAMRPKEIGKLIRLLEAQLAVLQDD